MYKVIQMNQIINQNISETDYESEYLFFQGPHLLLNISQAAYKFVIFLMKVETSVVFIWRLSA